MIIGILQARMSSRRLPGKVLLPLAGRPMLARQIERVQRSQLLTRLVVATSKEPADEAIVSLAATLGVDCYAGSLEDVLDRFYSAAADYHPSHIVRLTGDCPLTDWQLIDGVVRLGLEGGYDYASNVLRRTWPDGLDVEIMTFAALELAWREATEPRCREHVTPFFYEQPRRFRLGGLEQNVDLSSLRWTVDKRADYDFVSRLYAALYPTKPDFTTADILAYLQAQRTTDSMASSAGASARQSAPEAKQE
jgi:spore coat polysaccharide biosynthesis protein SpsF